MSFLVGCHYHLRLLTMSPEEEIVLSNRFLGTVAIGKIIEDIEDPARAIHYVRGISICASTDAFEKQRGRFSALRKILDAAVYKENSIIIDSPLILRKNFYPNPLTSDEYQALAFTYDFDDTSSKLCVESERAGRQARMWQIFFSPFQPRFHREIEVRPTEYEIELLAEADSTLIKFGPFETTQTRRHSMIYDLTQEKSLITKVVHV